jgi:hypothetical protein
MRYTPLNGKFERKEQEEEGKKSTLLQANERTGRWQQRVFRYSFCISVCVFVVARSTVILIVCTAKKRERERERER